MTELLYLTNADVSGTMGARDGEQQWRVNLRDSFTLLYQYDLGGTMEWDCTYSKQLDGWVVEAVGEDGEMYVTQFYGPAAEKRANEYAGWKNSMEQPQDALPSRRSEVSYEKARYAKDHRASGRP